MPPADDPIAPRPIAFVSATSSPPGTPPDDYTDDVAQEEANSRWLEAVPEALHDALQQIHDDKAELAKAFFCSRGGYSGTHQLVLETDDPSKAVEGCHGESMVSQIVLKLDFDTMTWKKVRKKSRV